ncbi:M48 family metallopeptidase [Arcobacter sp. LA11]|uniref:M48 family metallopeptidase n=1 Tax=Arcobacter sp. LA11 TaxID=1898176 RepID=UPI0009342E34|nr:M48 family metallopeptidase [Arcobacter sp. LA11]
MKKHSIYLLTLSVFLTGCAKHHTPIQKSHSYTKKYSYLSEKKYNYLSKEEIKKICNITHEKIMSVNKICTDEDKIQKITSIAHKLLSTLNNYNIKDWEIIVLEKKEINAVCLADGKIFINSGIFRAAQNDGQIAAVLAHEISHVLLNHGEQKIKRSSISNKMQIAGTVIAGIFNPLLIIPFITVSEGAKYSVLSHYYQEEENEADENSLVLLKNAGYDLNETVKLWNNMKMINTKRAKTNASTHLSYNERIIQLKYMINQMKKKEKKDL